MTPIGSVAIVGAGDYIGAAIARRFARQGAATELDLPDTING